MNVWHWPQYVVAGMWLVELGCQLAMHGKPRTPNNFFFWLIGNAGFCYVLYAGGFFG